MSIKPRKYLGWHFIGADRRLKYADGREVVAGETYHQPDMIRRPELCVYGMHASQIAMDALKYAPGSVVCRVEISNAVTLGDDKMVGRSRKVLWVADASDTLLAFARSCALEVVHLWDAPQVVVDYFTTGNEALRRAARSASSNVVGGESATAVYDAAKLSSWTASKDADRAAHMVSFTTVARKAAWSASRAAALDADRRAPCDAARLSSAWNAHAKRLEAMLTDLMGECEL